MSSLPDDRDQVRIKCFLGDDIRVFHLARSITPERLNEELSRRFNVAVRVYQYEDNDGDKVKVHSNSDLEDALAVYDHMREFSKKIPTLKLVLKAATGSSIGELAPPPPTVDSDGKVSIEIEMDEDELDFTFLTPPLRTPPPIDTPPMTPRQPDELPQPELLLRGIESALPQNTPPLRTPPPSPPQTRRGSAEFTSKLATSLNTLSPKAIPRILEDERNRNSGSVPALRTPPRSPPDADSSDEMSEGDTSSEHVSPKTIRNHASPQPILTNRPGQIEELNSDNGSLITTNFQTLAWKKGQVIGIGGFGKVYLGLHSETGELFAVKQLELDTSNEEKGKKALLSYQKEIDLMKQLNHPNIVRYLGTQITDKGLMSIFLEYVPGGSISSLLSKFGAFSESILRLYTKQLLFGLKYLHENRIIHRDIKGANVLVDTKGNVKLADFGCAKIFAGLQTSNFKSILGTPYWMAPEVIKSEGYGRSADIWSLGCTIIEMASGKPPWYTEFPEAHAAMFHIAQSNETPQIPEHLSPEAYDLLLRCFKREPDQRPTAIALLKHVFIKSKDQGSNASSLLTISLDSEGSLQKSFNSIKSYSTPKNNSSLKNPIIPSFLTLPTELILHVFSFVEERDLPKLSLVSHNWRSLMGDDVFWRYKTLSRWKKTKKDEGVTWRDQFHEQEAHDLNWIYKDVEMRVFKSKCHTKAINAVIFNSWMVASASDDKKIKIWDIYKGKGLKTLRGHTGPVNCLSLTDEDTKLLSGSTDKLIKIWDIRDLKKTKTLKTLESHTSSVTSIQNNGTKLVSCSLDKKIKIWDIHTGKVTSTLQGHSAGINAIQFLDHTIVSCSQDSTLKVFDTRMEKCTRTLEGHTNEVLCLQFDNHNNLVISGSLDNTLKEWDLGSGTCIYTFKAHQDAVCAVGFDSNKIISGSKDKTIKIFNRHTQNCVRTLQGHSDAILALRFDDKKIISGSKDKTLGLWATCTFDPLEPWENEKEATGALLSLTRKFNTLVMSN